MATTISSGTNPYKLGSPPDFGTLYSGRALDFDGVVDYVDMGIDLEDWLEQDDKTMSVWVNNGGNASEGRVFNVGYDDSGSKTGFGLGVNAGTNNKPFYFLRNTSADALKVEFGDVMAVDSWHYFVIVQDTSENEAYIYQNGVLKSTVSSVGTVSQSTNTSAKLGEHWNIGVNQAPFNGKISNFQLWDKAWSLSDVQYAYTHPEKLITDNSAVTSGTTISNLKAWYPCTEGNPRSPQTTVYDGSPKELGSEVLTNGGFDEDASWSKFGSATISGGAAYLPAATSGYIQQAALTVGKVYYYTLSAKSAANGTLNLADGATTHRNISSVPSIYTTYTGYFTADHVTIILSESSTGNIYIDSISVKEVQMGNHGTTTFVGDELIDEDNNRLFESATDVDWVALDPSGGSAVAISVDSAVANKLQVTTTTDNAVEGAQLPIANIDNAGADPVVAGRTYRISMDLDVDAGTPSMSMQLGGATSSNFSISTTEATYTQDLTPTDATSALTIRNVSGTALVFTVDNVSVKEIGVATGWTTADAEPLIPQTALMGMSKPMVFDGYDDYLKVDSAIGNLGSTASISAWISRESVTSGASYLFDARGDGAGGTGYCTFGGGVATFEGSDGTEYVDGALGATAPVDGKFHHLVLTGATVNIAEDIRFGARYNNISLFYGVMNEISLWNKTLSLAEVQELFNDGVPLDATTHSASPSTGTDNLIGYWRNDGAVSWSDISQNSNNGTPAGSPVTLLLPEGTTSGKDILGFPLTHTNNGWLNLSGAEYVDVGMNFDDMTDFTLEAWARVNVYENYSRILGCENSEYEQHLRLDNSNHFQAKFHIGTTEETIAGTTNINDGEWHYVTVTYDGTNLKIYTDDDDEQSTAASGTVDANGKNLFIGARNDNGTANSWLKGQVDEVRIYDRVLTSAEITKNYNHGKSKHS